MREEARGRARAPGRQHRRTFFTVLLRRRRELRASSLASNLSAYAPCPGAAAAEAPAGAVRGAAGAAGGAVVELEAPISDDCSKRCWRPLAGLNAIECDSNKPVSIVTD